jgi:bud site selection protein 31
VHFELQFFRFYFCFHISLFYCHDFVCYAELQSHDRWRLQHQPSYFCVSFLQDICSSIPKVGFQKKKPPAMPKIRAGMPPPPAGFDKIAEGLDRFDAAMRDALAAPAGEGVRRSQRTWDVTRISRERTRYVCDMFRRREISALVLKYCATHGFVDGTLARLWGVKGYEALCCPDCVDAKASAFGSGCVCRVPMRDRPAGTTGCSRCGCTGCCSSDVAAARAARAAAEKQPEPAKPTAVDEARPVHPALNDDSR